MNKISIKNSKRKSVWQQCAFIVLFTLRMGIRWDLHIVFIDLEVPGTGQQCLEGVQESLLWLERNPVEGRSLQAIVSREICCCEKEKLPRLVMTKVKSDARKSRQPLNPKIKSGKASLVLHKMWRDWTLSIYINEVKSESWIKVMGCAGNNWKSLCLQTPRQSVLKKEAQIFGVI